jgi:hypothetical protein
MAAATAAAPKETFFQIACFISLPSYPR